MNQTGVRIDGAVAGLSRAERIAALRARIDAVENSAAPARQPKVQPAVEVVGVPSALAGLLPAGGLARRQAVACSECAALAVELITHVSAHGGHVGVVGWPNLSLAQVAEEGDVSRVVTVPDAGADPWAVTGILCEGLDLVIHRGTGELSPTRARPVLAKLRGGQAAVLTVGTRLPGTSTALRAEVVTFRGVGKGSGRIRGLDIDVHVDSKGRNPVRGVVTCGQRRRLEAV
ncbi:hypothetical protein [Corynebacterium sp.]|uniref:hypothetical protein n=1 Tax=Corynebacterium sp. TaxID=1720 RepID=UPI0026DA8D3F|nr:hypothetical protein [Corynebacterium sp.]MDO5031236.1 hypothetical protein [Corynebacterium sp.]